MNSSTFRCLQVPIFVLSFKHLQKNFELVSSSSTWVAYELEKSQSTKQNMLRFVTTNDFERISILINHFKDTELFNTYINEHYHDCDTDLDNVDKITQLFINNGADVHIQKVNLICKIISQDRIDMITFLLNSDSHIGPGTTKLLIKKKNWDAVILLLAKYILTKRTRDRIIKKALKYSKEDVMRLVLEDYDIDFDFIFELVLIDIQISCLINLQDELQQKHINYIFCCAINNKNYDAAKELCKDINVQDYMLDFIKNLFSYRQREDLINIIEVSKDLPTLKMIIDKFSLLQHIGEESVLFMVRYGNLDLIQSIVSGNIDHTIALEAIKYGHISIVKKYFRVDHIDQYITIAKVYSRYEIVDMPIETE